MPSASYRRREPEKTALYQVVQSNLSTFIAQAEEEGRGVPDFVQRRLARFLGCGILSRGFVRVVCDGCKEQHLIAFSCKVRGLCPSCSGRRMAESAAHLVDNVFPRVPVRQWVLSLPMRLRYILAYDAELCGKVLGLFIREVYRWYRWTAKVEDVVDSVLDARCGSVTFIQRADSGLKLNLHFHALVMDGVYVQEDDLLSPPTFYAMPEPTNEAIAHVAVDVRRKVLKFLEEQGYDLGDADAFDDFNDREPLLAACSAASLTGTVTSGARAGRRVERLRDNTSASLTPVVTSTRCANAEGFSLHANTRIKAADRKGLEKLFRYCARGPIANDRLRWLPDGRLAYDLKRVWSDGSRAVIFDALDFIAKLLPLLPPPKVNQIRFHGQLAPCASLRDQIVPQAPAAGKKNTKNYCWAELMKRTFDYDVLVCPKCCGPMRLIATITDRETIRAILGAVGLPADSPKRAPAQIATRDLDEGWSAA
ncbi:MAG: transposase [Myxococcota bacterium]